MAVCSVMLLESFFFVNVMYFYWKTSLWKIFLYIILFFTIDGAFWSSNMRKFISGGFLPVCISILLSISMVIWYYGSEDLIKERQKQIPSWEYGLQTIKEKSSLLRSPGSLVVIESTVTPSEKHIPVAFWQWIQTMNVLPQKTILLQLQFLPIAFASEETSIQVQENLVGGFYVLQYQVGFAEKLDYLKLAKILNEISNRDGVGDGNGDHESGVKNDQTALVHRKTLIEESKVEEKIKIENTRDIQNAAFSFLICREIITSNPSSVWTHRLFVQVYRLLAKTVPDVEQQYQIPEANLIETAVRLYL